MHRFISLLIAVTAFFFLASLLYQYVPGLRPYLPSPSFLSGSGHAHGGWQVTKSSVGNQVNVDLMTQDEAALKGQAAAQLHVECYGGKPYVWVSFPVPVRDSVVLDGKLRLQWTPVPAGLMAPEAMPLIKYIWNKPALRVQVTPKQGDQPLVASFVTAGLFQYQSYLAGACVHFEAPVVFGKVSG